MTRRGGFTLVEMLVVIVILAVLASLAAGGVVVALRSAQKRATRTLILTIEAALDRYRNEFQDYPPTLPADLGRRRPIAGLNDRNNGSEALLACLATRERGGPFLNLPNAEEAYGNLDGDQSAAVREATDWWFGDAALREVLDRWGAPVVYWHARDYAKQDARYATYTMLDGEKQTWRPQPLKATGQFPNPQGFVLVSPGPDGQLGTEDDVTNWR